MRRLLPLLLVLVACNDSNISSSNVPPTVQIVSPPNGWTQPAEQPLTLVGVATDSGTAANELALVWSSSLSGTLFEGFADDDSGQSTVTVSSPEAGEHVITFRAADAQNAAGTESITITVVEDRVPTCQITTPEDGDIFDPDLPVLFQAQVGDDFTAITDLVVVWTSDLDGELSTAGANELGVVSFSADLSIETHEITLEVTDGSGLVCTDLISVGSNGAPTAPEIELSPDPVAANDDLEVLIVTEAVDPEGSPIDYAIAWSLDGTPRPDLDLAVIPAAELARDQLWEVEVRAADNSGNASEGASASIVVSNTPPSIPVVEVAPTDPTQNDDLICSIVVASTDIDAADSVSFSFEWLVDGLPSGETGAQVSFLLTSPGEDWTCRVTPNDGTDDGPAGDSTVSVTAGCASLNGTTGSAIVTDDPSLRLDSGDFTVEAWMKPLVVSEAAVVSKRGLGADNGWHLGIGSDGRPFFQVSIGANPRVDATTALTANAWHHVALVYTASSGIGTFWIDGAVAGSGALPSPNGTADPDLVFLDDGAGLPNLEFIGLLDDVKVSDVARYALAFVPPTVAASDGNTLGLWTLEAGAGSLIADASGNGNGGVVAGASWSTDSTCGLDLAPSTPGVAVTPEYPDDDDPLDCALTIVSVDPEGNPVTYAGEWLVDGVPSGQTFTTLPASLPANFTAEGEEWTCSVVANDGVIDSAEGTDSVFAGSMPVCTLEVSNPAAAASTSCGFTAPILGLLRFTMDNPDSSRDGTFTVDLGTLGMTWLFTGKRDWGYAGDTIVGAASIDVELNASPALGALALALEYAADSGLDNTGTDTLLVDFVYYDQLTTAGATFLASHEVTSQQSSDANFAATNVNATISAGERLLMEANQCGSAGFGGHGLYADTDGSPGNDGLTRTLTGDGDYCAEPLRSISIDPGQYLFSLAHEDDFFTDNSGSRELTLYRYAP